MNVFKPDKIFVAEDHLLFLGKNIATQKHKHQFLQFIVVIDTAQNFELNINNEIISGSGLLIASHIEHKFQLNNQRYSIILIDPTSLFGTCLAQHYLNNNAAYRIFNRSQLHFLIIQLLNFFSADIDNNTYLQFWQDFQHFFQFKSCLHDHHICEPRISTTLKSVNLHKLSSSSISFFAKSNFISASRFSHLFKDATGYALKNYLLFQQIVAALKQIAAGNSVTIAALNAGFDSTSHFSSACKKMTGLNPRSFAKVSVFLEVSYPKNFYSRP